LMTVDRVECTRGRLSTLHRKFEVAS